MPRILLETKGIAKYNSKSQGTLVTKRAYPYSVIRSIETTLDGSIVFTHTKQLPLFMSSQLSQGLV